MVHNVLMQLFTLGSSKIKVLEPILLISWSPKMTIQGMYVLGRMYVFFTIFAYYVRGWGSPRGLLHNLVMQLFMLGSFKIEVSETHFFDIVIT